MLADLVMREKQCVPNRDFRDVTSFFSLSWKALSINDVRKGTDQSAYLGRRSPSPSASSWAEHKNQYTLWDGIYHGDSDRAFGSLSGTEPQLDTSALPGDEDVKKKKKKIILIFQILSPVKFYPSEQAFSPMRQTPEG